MKTPFGSRVLDVGSRLLTPFIILFGIYVIFHGHYSPGGGFQGGTIVAVGVILMRLVQGNSVNWGPSRILSLSLALAGVGIYICLGTIPLFYGGTFLDYAYLPIHMPAANLRALGTLGIEIGVGLAVPHVLLLIFAALSNVNLDEDSL